MNKKRVLSLVLSFALVFTTVFAGAGSVFADTTADSSSRISLKASLYPDVEEEGFSAKAMLTSAYAAPAYNTYYVPLGGYARIVPIEATSTGWMYLDAKAGADNGAYSTVILIDKYEYDSSTNMLNIPDDAIGTQGSIGAGATTTSICKIPVTKGETYYAWLQSASYSSADAELSIRARIYTTGARNLSQGTSNWTIVSGINQSGEYGKATWFKIKPTKTGLMTVNLKEYGYSSSTGTVQLYNANKKAVSEAIYHNQSSNRAKFGVKKNTTYYIKVTNCYGSNSESYKYGIKYSVTGYTDRAIGKKASAKKLVRKASATNTLFTASTSTSTDWYKFYVSSKRATRININAADIKSGKLTVTIYKGTKKVDNAITVSAGAKGPIDITYGTTYGKANAGWYYVKVVKSSKASGKYSIRYVY